MSEMSEQGGDLRKTRKHRKTSENAEQGSGKHQKSGTSEMRESGVRNFGAEYGI